MKIFSKEFIFAFFILSGTLKGILLILGIRMFIDLTLLSAIFITLIMFWHMIETLHAVSILKVELISMLTLFYLFMIVSLSYTSSESASITKTINFGTMVLAFYFPLFLREREFNLNIFLRFLTSLIFISSIIFLNFFMSYLYGEESTIQVMTPEEALHMTALYLTISWLNGILVVYYLFQNKEIWWIRWGTIFIGIIFLLIAGGRGPLLDTILILLVYIFYQLLFTIISFKIKRAIFPLIIIIFSMTYTIFIVSNVEMAKYHKSLKLLDNTVMRLVGLFVEKNGGVSAHSRVEYMLFAIDKINQKSLLGYGIGSFGYEQGKVDFLNYPHNILLEVWFELGYIPLLIFLFIFYRIYKEIDSSVCPWCLALFFYFLLNLLKSSSLIDMRMTLGFYAIFLIIESSKE